MKTIRMIFGSYGLPDGKFGVKLIDCGQTCEVDDAEAERLIALGVAAPVVATPQEPQAETGTGENTPAPETPQEPLSGSLDPEQLSTMTNADLKKLAEDLGLDTAKLRVKADFVAAISAVEFPVEDDPDEDEDGADDDADGDDEDEDEDTVEDGEAPPDLKAEAPVV